MIDIGSLLTVWQTKEILKNQIKKPTGNKNFDYAMRELYKTICKQIGLETV